MTVSSFVRYLPNSTDTLPQDESSRLLGIMIHDVREFMARSVEEAAQLAGMEPSEWAAVEDGNLVIDPAWLRPMADALGIRNDQMQSMVHLSQFVW